jgi:hypothetical protein
MLKKTIQTAIEHRQALTLCSYGEWFTGVPIDTDVLWLRLICMRTDSLETGHWIVRLDSISSVGISQCNWKERDDFSEIEQIVVDDDEPGEGFNLMAKTAANMQQKFIFDNGKLETAKNQVLTSFIALISSDDFKKVMELAAKEAKRKRWETDPLDLMQYWHYFKLVSLRRNLANFLYELARLIDPTLVD